MSGPRGCPYPYGLPSGVHTHTRTGFLRASIPIRASWTSFGRPYPYPYGLPSGAGQAGLPSGVHTDFLRASIRTSFGRGASWAGSTARRRRPPWHRPGSAWLQAATLHLPLRTHCPQTGDPGAPGCPYGCGRGQAPPLRKKAGCPGESDGHGTRRRVSGGHRKILAVRCSLPWVGARFRPDWTTSGSAPRFARRASGSCGVKDSARTSESVAPTYRFAHIARGRGIPARRDGTRQGRRLHAQERAMGMARGKEVPRRCRGLARQRQGQGTAGRAPTGGGGRFTNRPYNGKDRRAWR